MSGAKRATDEKRAETIESNMGTLAPTPRRINLSTLRDVRLELAAVYRQMDAGSSATQDGTRKAYVLKTIADVITLAELEKRIQELESQQGRTVPGQRALSERTVN
jgi:hypothetical protein